MIENLSVLLHTKYNYTLKSMKRFQESTKPTRFVGISLFVFFLFLVVFILGNMGIIEPLVDFFFMLFAFFSLVMIPLALRSKKQSITIIITPKYIIQALGKTEFVIIEYDEITKYDFDNKHGLAVFQKRKKIVIPFSLYEKGLEPLIDILEAKGKTFDPKKDFMIRPIEVIIENGEILIKDVEVVTSTDMIFERFLSDYDMLTPGFLKEIMFRNSVIDESFKGENCIIMKLGTLTVSPGHPENTTFDSVEAEDCIVIFEGVEVLSASQKDNSVKDSVFEDLPKDVKSFLGRVDKGIIADSNMQDNIFNVEFAVSLDIIKVSFTYNDVIVGWNNIKK